MEFYPVQFICNEHKKFLLWTLILVNKSIVNISNIEIHVISKTRSAIEDYKYAVRVNVLRKKMSVRAIFRL